MKPILSIVTITLKNPDGLKATVESLHPLLKLGLPWEHVIVDSSLKEHAENINALPEDWPLAHVPSPPRGIYAAINLGVESAEGEFVQLLHAGDRLHDGTSLERIVDAMRADPSVDVLCAAAALYRGQKFLYYQRPPRTWLRGLLGMNRFCHQAMLYRRSRLLKVGPFSLDYPIASDYEHHYRCYLRGHKLRTAEFVLAEFDMGGASSNFRQALAEFRAVQLALIDKLPLYVNLLNALVWRLEEKRIRLFKNLTNSPLGGPLRRLWHWWKR